MTATNKTGINASKGAPTMRTHDGYSIRVRQRGDTADIQYRHYSARTYDLSQQDAINLATTWAKTEPLANVVIVTDEGSRHGDHDHVTIATISGQGAA